MKPTLIATILFCLFACNSEQKKLNEMIQGTWETSLYYNSTNMASFSDLYNGTNQNYADMKVDERITFTDNYKYKSEKSCQLWLREQPSNQFVSPSSKDILIDFQTIDKGRWEWKNKAIHLISEDVQIYPINNFARNYFDQPQINDAFIFNQHNSDKIEVSEISDTLVNLTFSGINGLRAKYSQASSLDNK